MKQETNAEANSFIAINEREAGGGGGGGRERENERKHNSFMAHKR